MAAKSAELHTSGKRVAMVGDAVDGTPAPATPGQGIALGAGTGVVIEAADAARVCSYPLDVFVALRVGSSAVRGMHPNLGWAVGCDVMALPIAAGVVEPAFGLVLRPEIAAVLMAGPRLLVAVDALLITCLQPPAPATPSGPTRLSHGRSLRPRRVSAAVQHRHDLRRDHPGLELGLVQTAERDHDLRLDVGKNHAVVLDRPERRDREQAGTRRHQDEQTDQREDRPVRHGARKAPTCGGRNRSPHEALSGR